MAACKIIGTWLSGSYVKVQFGLPWSVLNIGRSATWGGGGFDRTDPSEAHEQTA